MRRIALSRRLTGFFSGWARCLAALNRLAKGRHSAALPGHPVQSGCRGRQQEEHSLKHRLIPALAILAGSTFSCIPAFADRLSPPDFDASAVSAELIDNALFLPPSDAKSALAPFEGRIDLSETAMPTAPESFKSNDVFGRDPQLFPQVSLEFITVGDDLVPSTQDVIRVGSTENGKSFWDVIVQPGKVWSEGDDGWSRASFPFSLVYMLEGETHNGVAMFLYKDGEVSDLRYQILTQTSPFYVEDYFTASGSVPATLAGTSVPDASQIKADYEKIVADREDFRTWKDLEKKVGAEALKDFNTAIRPSELVLDGLVVDDTFYLRSCPTPAGELPYCERQRFGVWSVSKSAVAATALLAVAEKYGPEVFNAKIADYVPQAAGLAGWDKVTFGNALNMATGMGYGQREAEPKTMWSPYSDDYYAFYEARSANEKLDILLKAAKPYDWGPGVMPRYRDEDMFLLGAALTNYLQSKEDPASDLWTFLQAEVYEPVGIHGMPNNQTIETGETSRQPIMAWGLYATAGDLVKIARLYQNGGRHDGKQILNADLITDIAVTEEPVGLPTSLDHKPYYSKAFWRYPFEGDDCSLFFPSMDGWGENHVMLMPGGVTAIRLARNWDGDESAKDVTSIIRTGNAISPFCADR
ncbi:beta-lactamase family protein [Rhodobacterales bacterium]|nr:beta-lactamase family protein [Rhodobacterales bacterium]